MCKTDCLTFTGKLNNWNGRRKLGRMEMLLLPLPSPPLVAIFPSLFSIWPFIWPFHSSLSVGIGFCRKRPNSMQIHPKARLKLKDYLFENDLHKRVSDGNQPILGNGKGWADPNIHLKIKFNLKKSKIGKQIDF